MKIVKSKKIWITGGSLLVALGILAGGLGSTLAAKSTKQVRVPAPNSYITVEVGATRTTSDGGSPISGNTSVLRATSYNGAVVLTGVKAGVTSYAVGASRVTSNTSVQVTDARNIAGYDLAQGGELNKKSGSGVFSLNTYLTAYTIPAGGSASAYQENSAALAGISWVSSDPDIASCTPTGQVTPLKKGAVMLLGEFTDRYGSPGKIACLLGVDLIVGNSDLADLLEAIQKAEIILNLSPNPYTQASLDALQAAVNAGKGVVNQSNPSTSAINSEILKIESAITGLVMEQGTGTAGFSFVIDTSISPSNAAFGTSAKNLILQIGSNAGNNYQIDWGDGVKNANTASHTYADAKEYTVKISGDLPGGIIFRDGSNGEFRLKRILTPLLDADTQDMSDLFQWCTNLTSIPADLFVNYPGATSFKSVFARCTRLTAIPAGLFDKNTKATTFDAAFANCTSLTAIPTGLFDQNTKATSFEGAFYSCTGIKTVPTELFDKNTEVTSFATTFYGCTGIIGTVPELWAKFPALPLGGTLYCFYNCTNAANYSYVPPAWR